MEKVLHHQPIFLFRGCRSVCCSCMVRFNVFCADPSRPHPGFNVACSPAAAGAEKKNQTAVGVKIVLRTCPCASANIKDGGARGGSSWQAFTAHVVAVIPLVVVQYFLHQPLRSYWV